MACIIGGCGKYHILVHTIKVSWTLSSRTNTATNLLHQLSQDLDTLAIVAVVLHVFRACELVALLISNGYKTVILP